MFSAGDILHIASTPEHCIKTRTLHQDPNIASRPEHCINTRTIIFTQILHQNLNIPMQKMAVPLLLHMDATLFIFRQDSDRNSFFFVQSSISDRTIKFIENSIVNLLSYALILIQSDLFILFLRFRA